MKRLMTSALLGAAAMLAAVLPACSTDGKPVPPSQPGPVFDTCPSAAALKQATGKGFADPVHASDEMDLAFEGVDCGPTKISAVLSQIGLGWCLHAETSNEEE